MRVIASGMRLPSPQAATAVSAEAQNSTSMPAVPEMVVASARPRTPIRRWNTLLRMTLATTMPADTYMVVRVSCMAWNVRLSRSRRPKPSTPIT